ncbi:MAG TPA: cupredoxin domain-containing protein [Chloroflexota bacterium]
MKRIRWQRIVVAIVMSLVFGIGVGNGIPPVRAQTFDVSVLDNAYSPEPFTIAPGTTVVWTNHGQVAHTITSDDPTTDPFDSNVLAPGKSFSHTFNHPGVFTYHCSFHDNMLGTIIVQGASPAPRPTSTTVPTSAPSRQSRTTVFATALDGSYRFTPKTLTVKVGTRVAWQNASAALHAVTSRTHGWSFVKRLSLHATVAFTFKKPGTYRYVCALHPGMSGKVVVHR